MLFFWCSTALFLLVIKTYTQWPSDKGEVFFCDVGQGDGIIVQQGFYQLIVDTGQNNGRMEQCLSTYLPWWDRNIELFVLTHADSDHIGGAPSILKKFKVEELLFVPLSKQTPDFLSLKALLLENMGRSVKKVTLPFEGNTRVLPLDGRVEVLLAGTNQTVIETAKKTPSITTERELWDIFEEFKQLENQQKISTNDESIVLFLKLQGMKILLTGDIEEKGEKALVDKQVLSQVDVLKVAHHGSKTSSSLDFIKRTLPEWGILSLGLHNTYGHPHSEVVLRLEEVGTNLLRTDQLGTIILNLEETLPLWITERN